jgi:hypothetical protein
VPAVIRAVYLNTGSGFARNERLTAALVRAYTPLPPTTGFDPSNPDHHRLASFVVDTKTQGYAIVDLNGDGLSDLVRTHGAFAKEAHLGTGVGWIYDAEYSASLASTLIESVTLDGSASLHGASPSDESSWALVSSAAQPMPSSSVSPNHLAFEEAMSSPMHLHRFGERPRDLFKRDPPSIRDNVYIFNMKLYFMKLTHCEHRYSPLEMAAGASRS